MHHLNLVNKELMMRIPDFCGIFQNWPNKCDICSRLNCITTFTKFLLIKFSILVALLTIVIICVFHDSIINPNICTTLDSLIIYL